MFETIVTILAIVGVIAIFLTFAVETILFGVALLTAYLLVEQVREFVHALILWFAGG